MSSRRCRRGRPRTGHGFFPRLITQPFSSALSAAFTFAVITCVLAAAASLLRGGKYDWTDRELADAPPGTALDGLGGPPLASRAGAA